jgi:hypothetical protein
VTDEAAADVTIGSLKVEGEGASTELIEAITDARLKRAIDEVPTLTIAVRDPKRTLLRSGIFSKRITTQLDNKSFELAQVRKTGSELSLVLEDLAAAELRRHDTPLKVDAGTMTRIQFARRLLQETPWIPLVVSPTAKAEIANVELARGTVAAEGQEEQKEDTWTCLKRIFAEIGWRCYIDYTIDGAIPGVNVGPDYAYLDRGTVMRLKEAENGVDDIDFDWDVGKPMATARLKIRAHRWQAPPGTPVTLEDVGPGNGDWIVSSIERSLFSTNADVELKLPEPDLPEPPPPDTNTGDTSDDTGSGVTAKNVGGFQRPVNGTVSAPFGDGRGHKGIDIAARTGTTIVAARAGTVTFAGTQSGYGQVVYITHEDGLETRYAHMSKMTCRRGLQVSAGTKIGEVGATGDATGPHLHFEIRVNGRAINPAKKIGY